MTDLQLYPGDNRVSLRRLIGQGVRVHSVVCDPPYGLTSVTRRFGKEGAAPAKYGSDGAFARASAGFMGSTWDGTGIERDPEFWALVHETLLPGGYCIAFSGARTGHWQACAMELAGFIMHPMIGWVYGQGFPKDHDAERAVAQALCPLPGRHFANEVPPDARPNDHVCPRCPESAEWEGWAYGAQSLKPALEPIYVGQKPFSEKNGALNLLRHGVGALNIDACRAHAEDAQGGEYTIKRLGPGATNNENKTWKQDREFSGYQKPGRHPANLVHDGSEVVLACFPDAPGQIARSSSSETRKNQHVYGEMKRGHADVAPRGDSGSAARFFNAFRVGPDEWVAEPICEPLIYQAKATKADRAGSKHPTVKPVALMRWLCRLVTPPGGVVLDPFAGSGTTGHAALEEGFDCILMEAEEQFCDDIRRRFQLAPASSTPTIDEDVLGFELDDDVLGFDLHGDPIG